MKKLVLYFVLLFLFFAAITPFIFGYLFKNIYYANILAIKHDYPHLMIKVVSYDVGWLESNVVTAFNAPDGSHVFTANATIHHGPMIKTDNGIQFAYANIQTIIHLPDWLQEYIPDDGNGFMRIDSQLALNGMTMTSHFIAPPISIAKDSQSQFIWDGLTGLLITQMKDNQPFNIYDQMTIGKMYGRLDRSEIWIDPIEYNITAIKSASGLWNDSYSVKFNSIIAKSMDGSLISINHLNHDANAVVSNGFYNVDLNLSIEQILSPSAFISRLSNIKFTSGVKNINAAEYAKFIDMARQNANHLLEQRNASIAILNMLFPALTPNFSIDTSIAAESNLGAGSANLSFTFNQVPKAVEEIPNDLNCVFNARVAQTLVSAVWAKFLADYRADYARVTGQPVADSQAADDSLKIKALMDDYIQNNYIKQAGSDYLISIKKINQDIILNDQKIDVNAVFMHIEQSLNMLNATNNTAVVAPVPAN